MKYVGNVSGCISKQIKRARSHQCSMHCSHSGCADAELGSSYEIADRGGIWLRGVESHRATIAIRPSRTFRLVVLVRRSCDHRLARFYLK